MNRYIFIFTFRRQKLRVFGLALLSFLLVVGCTGLMVLISLAGWELFKRPTTVVAQGQLHHSTQQVAGVVAASISQPRAITRPTVVTSPIPRQIPIVRPSLTSDVTPMPLALPIPITPTSTLSPSPTPSPPATALPTPTATPLRVINPDGVATRLVIPKINLDTPVLLAPFDHDTWRVDHLEQAIGQLEGTAPPGTKSNIVLAGHVTLDWNVYGPFAQLDQLSPGDLVLVYEKDEGYLYQIDNLYTVDHTTVEVTYPSNTGEITLITCTNWNEVEGRYAARLIVKGHLLGRY